MKVLIATEHSHVVGGIETYLQALAPRLRESGLSLGWIFGARQAVGVGFAAGAEPTWWSGAVRDAGVLRGIEEWRPDVVFSHGLAQPEVEAELALRFPAAHFAHGYFGTCISGAKCHANRGHRACTRQLGPGCLAAYLPYRCGGRNPVEMLRLYGYERQRQGNLPLFGRIIVASRHMAEEYRRHGVPGDRITTLPYFPPQTARDAVPPTFRDRTDRVLFVGRLTSLKGGAHLIEAMAVAAAQLRRTLTLVVAGDGVERRRLESLARGAGVPAEFHGWVSAPERQRLTRGVDLLAVPSLWPEPFGIVGIEAGCLGVPAVAYASGGITDWLEQGVSGECAPAGPAQPAALASAIVRALADDAHWQRLRVGAWKAAGAFDLQVHLEGLQAVFSQLAGSSRGQDAPSPLRRAGFS